MPDRIPEVQATLVRMERVTARLEATIGRMWRVLRRLRMWVVLIVVALLVGAAGTGAGMYAVVHQEHVRAHDAEVVRCAQLDGLQTGLIQFGDSIIDLTVTRPNDPRIPELRADVRSAAQRAAQRVDDQTPDRNC